MTRERRSALPRSETEILGGVDRKSHRPPPCLAPHITPNPAVVPTKGSHSCLMVALTLVRAQIMATDEVISVIVNSSTTGMSGFTGSRYPMRYNGAGRADQGRTWRRGSRCV